MKRPSRTLGVLALLVGLLAGPATAADLREAVPNGAYVAAWSKHNPERDYQKAYEAAFWQTVEDTKIVEKFIGAMQGQMSEQESAQFDQVKQILSDALAPIDWDALGNSSESVFAVEMNGPNAQFLLMLRVPDEGAESLVKGINNLFGLVGQMSQGQVGPGTESIAGVEFSTLQLPPQVPMRPYVGVVDGEIFVFGTSADMIGQSLELLKNPSATSKFDDPRVKTALSKLPAPEDSLTFFDGKALFGQLAGIPDFIRQMSGGDPEAERIAGLMGDLFDQVAVIDYEVTVEYTNKYQNRTAAFGQLTADADEKLIGKMFGQAKPFENWSRWVPANATSYSLSSGVNLHPLYVWIMQTIPKYFPEAEQGFAQFGAIEDQIGIHLDADILQAFTGESVSLAFPAAVAGPLGNSKSVMFMRCTKPERIKELMDRGVQALMQIPDVQAQGLQMKDVPGLDGFQALSVNALAMMGVQPVIGFHNGWLVIGSDADAVKTALATQSGTGDTIADTEGFKDFELPIRGSVSSISYENLGENTRAMAQGLQQVGAMLPMMMGMAGQNGADLSQAQEFLALLPSVGRIIEKLDYYDRKLTVVQPGEGNTYTTHTVTLIKPPAR